MDKAQNKYWAKNGTEIEKVVFKELKEYWTQKPGEWLSMKEAVGAWMWGT